MIINSGQSGAGKTETSSKIIQYVVVVDAFDQDNSGSYSSLSHKILMGNTILESFGNAVTSRNANSSRFVSVLILLAGPYLLHSRELISLPALLQSKRTKIFYDSQGVIIGAKLETLLLERSRITAQLTVAERTFHVFYQLLEAPEAAYIRGQ